MKHLNFGAELGYSDILTKPKDLTHPDNGDRVLLSNMERWYIRVFGLPDSVKQQQAREIFSILKKHPFSTVLDVGCGLGQYSLRIAKDYPKSMVEAVDLDVKQIAIGKSVRQIYGLCNLQFSSEPLEKFEKDQFDIVLLLQTIEHLSDEQNVLSQIRGLMKDTGMLLITGPNRESTDLQKVEAICHVKDHKRLGYTDVESIELVQNCGFEVAKFKYLSGNIGGKIERLEHYLASKSTILFALFYPFGYILTFLDDRLKAKGSKYTSGFLIQAEKKQL